MSVWLGIGLAFGISAASLGTWIIHRGIVAHRLSRAIDRRVVDLANRRAPAELRSVSAFDLIVANLARISLFLSRKSQSQIRLVREAGFFAHGAVNRFLALRIVLPAVGAVLSTAFCTSFACPPIAATAITGSLIFAGYFGPALILRSLGRRRRRLVFHELPFFLDSIILLLQTGASLELALRKIAGMETAAIPEIRRTLPYFLEDLDQGKSYDVAFERWVEKLAAPDAEELAGLMSQSIKHGTELVPMLEQFIQDQIEQRLASAREVAGKRSVLLTVIMIAFFLPPVMAIISAPAVIDIARTIIR